MIKILLIGDFSDCLNYGAIATTNELKKMINVYDNSIELKTITYRSIMKKTPKEGWHNSSEEHLTDLVNIPTVKKKIKRILYELNLLDFYNSIKDKSKSDNYDHIKKSCHIPIKFKDFDYFIVNGKQNLPYEYSMLEWADVVLINAEGSIVRGTNANGVYRVGGLYSLFMAYWSKKANKLCYILNHTVDPGNRDIFDMIKIIYPMLDGIIVREPKSKKLLEELGIEGVKYYPDTLFAYRPSEKFKVNDYVKNTINFDIPYICIGDSSGMAASGIKAKWNPVKFYTKLIEELKTITDQIVFVDGFSGKNEDILKVIRKNNIPSIGLNNTDYHNLYYVLKHASIFISGRWHSSILSLLAETPILLWGSDSHKTEALYEMIDYKWRFFDVNTIPLHIEDIVKEAKDIINRDHSKVYEKVRFLAKESNKNVYMLEEIIKSAKLI